MLQRRKRESPEMDDADVQPPKPVTLNDTLDDIDTRLVLKNVGFFLLGLAWKLLLITTMIAIIGTALDFHNEWKRASRHAEVDIDKAKGTIESSTCLYYANKLSAEDRAKWEKSAIAETNTKCVEAEIIANQWHFIIKLRKLVHNYLPYESGQFMTYMRDGFFYVIGVMIPITGFLVKVVPWFTPIMTATRTFNDV
jgi:hypothetical protein